MYYILKPQFEMQQVLDDRIIEKKELDGQELLQDKFVALNTELGELVNENRTWKFWSENRRPRTMTVRTIQMYEEDKIYYDPQLEEFVDVFHFLLSVGNELGFSKMIETIEPKKELDLTNQFNALFYTTSHLSYDHNFITYQLALRFFFGLGEMLGYTWKQIEQTYNEKNAINHLRQSTSY